MSIESLYKNKFFEYFEYKYGRLKRNGNCFKLPFLEYEYYYANQKTLNNLHKLSHFYNISWSNVYIFEKRNRNSNKMLYCILIEGHTPTGEIYHYDRYECGVLAAGQTRLWKQGKKIDYVTMIFRKIRRELYEV